jgi:class 3 adenylate cyclase
MTLLAMEPSDEIRHVVTRFFEALRDGDDEAVSHRISRQPGFERFGSDPGEWWTDGETAARMLRIQMREMGGGYRWKLAHLHAMSEHDIGWAGARTEFDTPEGPKEMRFTCVLHLEHGEWKLVQWHSSVPSSNEELGFSLTTSVDGIAEEVSELRPDLSASSAPDGTVTIAFTDIEDSLRLNAALGDRRWLEVLHIHNDVIRRQTAEHGGTVVKSQGDGSMLAFASARRGLACAQAIDRSIAETFTDPAAPVRVRIGLHVGEPVREANDFFGHTVNYAARVAASARGGEIVVSSLVHDLLAQTGEFDFGDAREVELKGIDGRQTVYPVVPGTTAS